MSIYVAVNEYNEILFENDNKEQINDCVVKYLNKKYKLRNNENEIYKIELYNLYYTVYNKMNEFSHEERNIETIKIVNTSTSLETNNYEKLTNREIYTVINDDLEIYRSISLQDCIDDIYQVLNSIYGLNKDNDYSTNTRYVVIPKIDEEININDEYIFKVNLMNETEKTEQVLDEYRLIKISDESIEIRDKILKDYQEDIELINLFSKIKDELNTVNFPTAQEARILMNKISSYDFSVEKQQILRMIYRGNDKFTLIYKKQDIKNKIDHLIVLVEMLLRLGYELDIVIINDDIKVIITWQ